MILDTTKLSQRLNAVCASTDVATLQQEVIFFAEQAMKANAMQEKLIRISDAMQEMIREQRNELEKLNQQKNTLFSIVAHDLRSPYGAILNGLELLFNYYPSLDEEQRLDLTKKIYRSGRELMELLDNLLQWANIQMKGATLTIGPLTLANYFNQAAQLTKTVLESKGIQLVCEDNGLVVNADPMILDTVLRNLLTNASKFSHRAGLVRLSAQTQGNQIEIAVQDYGVGMDPACMTRLFNAGTKNHTLGTEQERGTGLGLIISQELLALLHSHLRVESAPGQGTTFRFSLPAA